MITTQMWNDDLLGKDTSNESVFLSVFTNVIKIATKSHTTLVTLK